MSSLQAELVHTDGKSSSTKLEVLGTWLSIMANVVEPSAPFGACSLVDSVKQ